MINYEESFLKELYKFKTRTQYVKIILLSFNELPIKEIQGEILSGNISMNSSSAVRRTISLSMLINDSNIDITNIDNIISINKKVKIEIGLKIPTKKWREQYGDIAWFPQGVFVLSSVNSSRSTNNQTLSITAKDKMCLLDGTAGGTFPATIVFHERYIENIDGSITIEHPILRQIIYEAVNHYGCEDPDNIIINDLPDEIKMLVKYEGINPIYFNANYSSFSYTLTDDYKYKFTTGEDVGYEMTPFTYPGELILQAGNTVVTLLDKIVHLLGNYEYFYDLEGHFIFQQIKNYVNKQSPLDELAGYNSTDYLPNLPEQDYVRTYNNQQVSWSFADLELAPAITQTPKYDNIKNDFYVWGKRKNASGTEIGIRYHLSIDAKPLLSLARRYMYAKTDSEGNIIRYETAIKGFPEHIKEINKVGPPCEEWREELYRQALMAKTQSGFGSYNNYYYEELIAEWRKLYNPNNAAWDATNSWNPDVFNNPEKLDFWLDFIDIGADIGKYSVSQIGRRTKEINNDNIKTIYNKEVPDIVFIPADVENKKELIEYYDLIGQKYFQLNQQYQNFFSISSTGTSCYDEIRELLYQHLNYNTTINFNTLPIYHLEGNNIIYIEDIKSGIIGNYQITQFSLPLVYNQTMSITATEVFTRV